MRSLTKKMIGQIFSRSNLPDNKVEVEMPQIVREIKNMQENGEFDTEAFEFGIDYYEGERNPFDPIDAIPFGFTGNNGIHFLFLTDFGTHENLDDAPIICVAPGFDPVVNLVARNIIDFFSIVTTIENSTLLADQYKDQEQFESRREEWFEGWRSEPETAQHRKAQADKLREVFSLRTIDDVVEYTKKIREDRMKSVETYEDKYSGLGINPEDNESIVKFEHTKEPARVKEFLNSNNLSSRLQFYRDCPNNFILGKENDYEIQKIIIKFLIKDGFRREAENLRLVH